MSNNPEAINPGPEKRKEDIEAIERAGAERREQLREQFEQEKSHEKTPEEVDTARHEVEKVTHETEKKAELDKTRETSPAERRSSLHSKAERDASFNMTMDEVHTQMSAPSRAFSKIIHNKTVERVSDATAATIARPNAILSGAVFAFVLTLGVYLVAKNLGYPLSGFETIGAFVLGWIIGILYDFLKVMITGRK
ncbi:MAG TPA: hypothetical protein VK502_04120 [Candidatus Saccharimonadales bacterium]|nr:hypothetical protein [Candidatus Saccharimonadales bacterium]